MVVAVAVKKRSRSRPKRRLKRSNSFERLCTVEVWLSEGGCAVLSCPPRPTNYKSTSGVTMMPMLLLLSLLSMRIDALNAVLSLSKICKSGRKDGGCKVGSS